MLRRYLKLLRDNYPYVVVDCEAGMEYLSRLTIDDVNTLIIVAELTGVGLTTAKRITELSKQLPIKVGQRVLLLNKVQSPVNEFDRSKFAGELPPAEAVVHVPFDGDLARRSSCGEPIDDAAGSNGRPAITQLAFVCSTNSSGSR
jgi:CO dehydrogenase nickel-insertion accessory protein CooC1